MEATTDGARRKLPFVSERFKAPVEIDKGWPELLGLVLDRRLDLPWVVPRKAICMPLSTSLHFFCDRSVLLAWQSLGYRTPTGAGPREHI
jgi:hypothetical protein